ncbi:hypothetical protein [Erythrobacter sp. F6033]|uniref:DUF7282 domain-containing protein n=1 Tax=Erythrobacter sp. F6033 TaxID=2926401 RepID=UPI001FF2736D|nr:hypothetical protein [Erythrobacter sp. F6033]MCK0127165.1 hypothetical protein [Erythrobacter sp. F6033]
MKRFCTVLAGATIVAACQPQADTAEPAPEHEAVDLPDPAEVTLGNGDENSIAVAGITRTGSTFTVPEVVIERAGWLVMHPFRDGAPVRNEYVGATLLPAGANTDVVIDVGDVPAAGDMFIIMLHGDMNEDGIFDFGDGETVPDAPIFEGNLMIAHPIPAPAEA